MSGKDGKFYSSKDVCETLQISKSTLFKWEREGLITKVRRDWRGWRLYDERNLEEIRQNIEKQKASEAKPRSSYVLVVDDDTMILQVMSDLLHAAGYDVLTASTGEEAVLMHQEKQPALTFLDVKLRGKSGIDVFREIRTVDPHAMIVILTGYPKIEDTVQVIKEGAYNYLTKPIKSDELLEMVAEVLGP
ncbi:MAG: response regulator [Calditrichaeota bacterium]|nr:response regulator [Calditrichota bacterium]MCB9391076.1 response regulator [Calditrichota bacterium]